MSQTTSIITLSTIINGRKNLVAAKTYKHATSTKRVVTYTADPDKAMTFHSGKEAYAFIDEIVNYSGRIYTVETIIIKQQKEIPAASTAA